VGATHAGIELTSGIGAGPITIGGNTITGVVVNTATSGTARGINLLSAAGPYTVGGNAITNIQAQASSQPAGIHVNTSAASGTVELNKVTTVYNRYTSTWGSYGVNLVGGTTSQSGTTSSPTSTTTSPGAGSPPPTESWGSELGAERGTRSITIP